MTLSLPGEVPPLVDREGVETYGGIPVLFVRRNGACALVPLNWGLPAARAVIAEYLTSSGENVSKHLDHAVPFFGGRA